MGASQVISNRAPRIRFGSANRVGLEKGRYNLVVSEHLGFGSDPSIRSDRRRGATECVIRWIKPP